MNRMWAAAAASVATMTVAGPAVAADCDRACLKGFVDGYFEALATRQAGKLPVSAKVKFTENGETLKLGEGFWKTGGPAGYRLELYDPQTGNAGVEAVVRENGQPVIYVLRLKVEAGKISEIETIVARKGSYGPVLWGPENLTAPSADMSLSIRPAEQNSRAELVAAAEGYWRAFETNGSEDYHPAPLIPSTLRIENGVQTTNRKVGDFGPHSAAAQFDKGLFKGGKIFDRRYPVIDVERGVVMSIVRFGPRPATPARANDAPLVMESFAVQAGKIHEIHAVLITRPIGSPTGW